MCPAWPPQTPQTAHRVSPSGQAPQPHRDRRRQPPQQTPPKQFGASRSLEAVPCSRSGVWPQTRPLQSQYACCRCVWRHTRMIIWLRAAHLRGVRRIAAMLAAKHPARCHHHLGDRHACIITSIWPGWLMAGAWRRRNPRGMSARLSRVCDATDTRRRCSVMHACPRCPYCVQQGL
jgi:hypothetical protein